MDTQEETRDMKNETHTVQQKAKIGKLEQLLSILLIFIGFILAVWGYIINSPIKMAGTMLFLVGFVWFIFSRVMVWWDHG